MKNKNTTSIFLFLTLLLFSAGWILIRIVSGQGGNHLYGFIFGAFFLAMVLFSLFLALSKSEKFDWLVALFCTSLSFFAVSGHFLEMVGIWVVGFLFFYLGINRIRKEKRSRIFLNIYMILKRGVFILGLSLSILISGGFYLSLVDKQELGTAPKIEIKIPLALTSKVLGFIDFFIPSQELSWIQEGMTVDEYMERMIESGGLILKSSESEASEEIEIDEDTKQELVKKERESMGVRLGIDLDGEKEMVVVVNSLLEKRLNDFFNGDYGGTDLLPIGAAVAMFLFLQAVSWALGFLMLWTAAGVFSILVRLKIIGIKTEMREVERVV